MVFADIPTPLSCPSILETERIPFRAQMRVSEEIARSAQFGEFRDTAKRELLYWLEQYMLGRKVSEDVREESRSVWHVAERVPATWLDHLKQTLQARWPSRFDWLQVRYREAGVGVPTHYTVHTQYHVCPHLASSASSSHVRFLAEDGSHGRLTAELLAAAREAVAALDRGDADCVQYLHIAAHKMRRAMERFESC